MTTIASRTPEGEPNRCPVCDAKVCIEPSRPGGDAPCPNCGVLLWFLPTSEGVSIYETESVALMRERLAALMYDNLGINKEQVNWQTSFIEDVGSDSLDIVELMMEIEEEFEITIPPDEAEKIRTVGDAMDAIMRYRR